MACEVAEWPRRRARGWRSLSFLGASTRSGALDTCWEGVVGVEVASVVMPTGRSAVHAVVSFAAWVKMRLERGGDERARMVIHSL